MFRGRRHVSLDAKGRLAMPAKFRDILLAQSGGHLVLTVQQTASLAIFPLSVWEAVENELYDCDDGDEEVERYLRTVVHNAEECELDAQGRFVVPPLLREYAGLNKQVVLAGYLKKIELWDEQRYMATEGTIELPARSKLPKNITSLRL